MEINVVALKINQSDVRKIMNTSQMNRFHILWSTTLSTPYIGDLVNSKHFISYVHNFYF